ncbi:MAG: TRCF domain-containing protein, partial [Oscillospiraceae bacterium]
RYGEPPASVQGLIDVALLRSTAASLGITEVKQQGTSILLYVERIDMKQISRLTSKMKGRILLSATATPYISIRLMNQPPLDALEDALKVMQENDG